MIPVHGGMMISAAAVNTRCRLEPSIPGKQLASIHLSHLNAIDPSSPPVLGVVRAAAGLAPRLSTALPAMELGRWLISLAAAAAARHVVSIDSEPDDAVSTDTYA
jgi:hypothetical protein